jgi:beta-galactosidase
VVVPAAQPSSPTVLPCDSNTRSISHYNPRSLLPPHPLPFPLPLPVEGNFSSTASKSQGYLPFGVGWYRHHFTVPSSVTLDDTIWIEFGAITWTSQVWLNGYFVASSQSAYTAVRFFVNTSQLVLGGGDNVLAVRADAQPADSWWYDGGGIPRGVRMTVIQSPPAVFLAPWGVYVPSNATGPISWSASGVPTADSALTPYIEIWSNSTTTQTVAVAVTVMDPSGNVVGTSSGSGKVPAGGNITWSPSSPISLPAATLWHLVDLPNKPALYTVTTTLSVGGVVVDNTTVRTGIRATWWSNATGFWLNGQNVKILSNANHQDFAAVGVAVPPHLQYYRVWKLKESGSNGWRTAHNVPDEKLMDAADELGLLVWDENHHNGQLDQVPFLVRRDRNRPSVIIWSICNEVLCDTSNGDWITNALAMKALMKELDPYMGRQVSANQNGWIGPNTPLDVQGFDYSTTSYDQWHAQAPGIPSISSETSSAVSDRGEYVNNATSEFARALRFCTR